MNKAVYGHNEAKLQIRRIIAQWINGEMKGAVLGLEGPPGTGKTSLAKMGLSKCLEDEDVLTIGLNRAVSLLAEPKKRRGPEVLKNLGNHPNDEGVVNVFEGRYGPYVNHGKTNATIPSNIEPLEITLEIALELLKDKINKSKDDKKKATKKKATKKKATKKKAAKKKAAKKKTTKK